MKNLKIKEFKMWPITFSGRKKENDIFVTPEQFKEVVTATRDFEIKEMGKEKEEFRYDPHVKNCGIGLAQIAVKSNGIVTPCLSFNDTVSVGNTREQSLIDIWNTSELLNKLRSMNVFETEHCKECEYAAVCKGGCIADVYGRTGKFSCYDPYSCVAFEMTKDDFIFVKDTSPSASLSVEVV
jgi:radical SAM protein with 4Fe4S-binding SPASM domain